MNEIEAVIALFGFAPTLAAITGGLWAEEVPAGTAMPYARMNELTGPDNAMSFGPRVDLEFSRVQLTVFATSKTQSRTLTDAVTAVFDFASLTTTPATRSCVRIRRPITTLVGDDEQGNQVWATNVVYDLAVQPS